MKITKEFCDCCKKEVDGSKDDYRGLNNEIIHVGKETYYVSLCEDCFDRFSKDIANLVNNYLKGRIEMETRI